MKETKKITKKLPKKEASTKKCLTRTKGREDVIYDMGGNRTEVDKGHNESINAY